jgi:GH25 family lysozyme M1 (1,4-beta-N-acetylmuramidase)
MTIFGPDISNNNGTVNIDRVADEGYAFVFAKVSEGSGFKDKFWPRTRDWCAQRGLLCVGYHYVKTDDPNAQARNFRDNGGGERVMLDFEDGSGDLNNYWACVNAFAALGIPTVVSYLPDWYWERIGKPTLRDIPGLLVRSEYTHTYPGDNHPNWNGYGGKDVGILQYGDDGLVAGLALDVNAFRGTKADLAAALGMGSPLLIPGVEGLPA